MKESNLTARYNSTVLYLLTLLLSIPTLAYAQITTNVLLRTLRIQTKSQVGTGFTLEVDKRQYLVTAKHVVADLTSEDTIQIFRKDRWLPKEVKVFKCDDPIDIAILVLPAQETISYQFEPPADGALFYIGQDAFFLGFPFGRQFSGGDNGRTGTFAIPFIKRALISAMTNDKGVQVLYLDGHNNRGFSGGPVVYRNQIGGQLDFRIAGVVSGYQGEYGDVFRQKEITPSYSPSSGQVIEKNGKRYHLIETDEVVSANTGIIVAYRIEHAVELIKRHPIGPLVSDSFSYKD